MANHPTSLLFLGQYPHFLLFMDFGLLVGRSGLFLFTGQCLFGVVGQFDWTTMLDVGNGPRRAMGVAGQYYSGDKNGGTVIGTALDTHYHSRPGMALCGNHMEHDQVSCVCLNAVFVLGFAGKHGLTPSGFFLLTPISLFLLHGTHKFQKNWFLFITFGFDNAEGESYVNILETGEYVRIWVALIVAGIVTSAKRTVVAMYFGRRTFSAYTIMLICKLSFACVDISSLFSLHSDIFE